MSSEEVHLVFQDNATDAIPIAISIPTKAVFAQRFGYERPGHAEEKNSNSYPKGLVITYMRPETQGVTYKTYPIKYNVYYIQHDYQPEWEL